MFHYLIGLIAVVALVLSIICITRCNINSFGNQPSSPYPTGLCASEGDKCDNMKCCTGYICSNDGDTKNTCVKPPKCEDNINVPNSMIQGVANVLTAPINKAPQLDGTVKGTMPLQSCGAGKYPCIIPSPNCIQNSNTTPLYKNNCTSYQNVGGSPTKSQLIKFFKLKTDEKTNVDQCLLLQEQIDGEGNFSIGQGYPELCKYIEHDTLCTDNQCKWVTGHDGVPSKCWPP
jgi:hypothetical protein